MLPQHEPLLTCILVLEHGQVGFRDISRVSKSHEIWRWDLLVVNQRPQDTGRQAQVVEIAERVGAWTQDLGAKVEGELVMLYLCGMLSLGLEMRISRGA